MDHPFRGQGGLFALLLAFLSGVFLGLAAGPACPASSAVLLVVCAALVALKSRPLAVALSVAALCGSLTAGRIPLADPADVAPYLDNEVVLDGRVAEIRATDSGWAGTVDGAAISSPSVPGTLRLERVLLYVRNPDRPVSFPARIRAAGRLHPVRGRGNPGEIPREVSAMAEGAQYAFSTEASRAVFIPEDPRAGGVAGLFSRARGRTGDWVRFHAGTSDGALYLLSLATGEVPAGSHPMVTLLRRTGLAHLLAISGVNVAVFHVMSVFFLRTLVWSFRMRHGTPDLGLLPAILSLPACWGYVLLAGAPVPAVRSAGMITLSVLAWRRFGVRAPGLAWSAMLFLTVAYAPLSILSPSLLLSYGATFFLIANFSVPVGEERSGLGAKFLGWVRASAYASTVAFFGTLPVSAAFFGTVPSGAILWNLLFGPLLGTGGVAGASVAVIGGAFGIDAMGPLVRIFTAFLSFGLSTLDSVSASGAGCFPVPPSGVAAPLLATVAAVAGTAWMLSHGRKPWIAPVASAMLFLGWLHLPYVALPSGEFSLTALNVGKGASHVVSFPGGGHVVIDCGSAARGNSGERVVLPFLRGRGIRKIDALVLTHPHEDHFGGAEAVLAAIPVGEIWLPEGVPRDAFGPAVSAWRGTVREVRAGFSAEFGGAGVAVRAPGGETGTGRANERGIVMEIRFGELSVWLPGDVEGGPSSWGAIRPGEAERRVLFLPHHGSPGADPGGWMSFCGPSAVVAQNRNCFDGGNLLPSGQRFLLENGAFTVRSDGRKHTLQQGGRAGGWKILWRLT